MARSIRLPSLGAKARTILLATCLALPAGGQAADLAPWDGPAPAELSLDSLQGGTVALADFAGQAVIVHFFATWCPPCIPELAALERLADRRAGQPVAILAIDVGEVDARVRRFFAAAPGFPVLLDRDRSVARAWGCPGCRRASCSTGTMRRRSPRTATSTGTRRRPMRRSTP